MRGAWRQALAVGEEIGQSVLDIPFLGPITIAPGVHQLRALGARVTVLKASDGAVLVDTGSRGSLHVIAAGLKALRVPPEKVRLIVLTHCHPDHAGGLAELVEFTSAPVAIHRAEAGIVRGDEPQPSFLRRQAMKNAHPFFAMFSSRPVAVGYPLEDGDALPEIAGVRVIHTPGHTEGSICLYVEAAKVLIVGDALQFRFGKLLEPSWLFTRDPEMARTSLAKLLEVDFTTICFSHFPPIQENAREMLEGFLRDDKD